MIDPSDLDIHRSCVGGILPNEVRRINLRKKVSGFSFFFFFYQVQLARFELGKKKLFYVSLMRMIKYSKMVGLHRINSLMFFLAKGPYFPSITDKVNYVTP